MQEWPSLKIAFVEDMEIMLARNEMKHTCRSNKIKIGKKTSKDRLIWNIRDEKALKCSQSKESKASIESTESTGNPKELSASKNSLNGKK